jgi:hypothetical protein
MLDFLRQYLAKKSYEHEIMDFLQSGRDKNYWSSRMLQNNKDLKKYIPNFDKVGDQYYKLLYENEDKTDIEHQFARLIVIKQTELYHSIMLLSFFEFSHAIIPLMRNFCDTVLFLKYVEKHPEYIKRFMSKNGKGISMYQIKNEIADQELNDYYTYLSELMHTIPTSVKLTYYHLKETDEKMMSLQPLNMKEFQYAYIKSLYNFMIESIRIIQKIYSKEWKPAKYKKPENLE